MSAAYLDIIIEEGATWVQIITIVDSSGTPMNLTGCTVTFKGYAPGKIIVIDLSTSSGIVLTSPTTGVLTITLSAAATEALDPNTGRIWYDLEVTDTGSNTKRVLNGLITVASRYQP